MEQDEIKNKIMQIVDALGMKGSVVAKAMGITEQTFNSKKDPNNQRHRFIEKNLTDLIAYIRAETEKL